MQICLKDNSLVNNEFLQLKTMVRIGFVILCLMFATPKSAQARYCPIHDPIALLHAILNSPDTDGTKDPVRFIVHGKLEIDPSKTVKSKIYRDHYYLKGYLRGKSLSQEGFINRFEAPVSVTSRCDTVSCEFLAENVLVLIHKKRERFEIFNDNACNLGVYINPDQETLDGMIKCLRGEGCAVTDDWYGVGESD
ncbi:hypothetical protein [Aliiroseovarius sp. 2305UL8-7]|uniref:hypothetical protein n=1 Tax=Aliiroseovarius conchicola TaxID=3121637 RepID=UPI0035297802